MNELEEKGNSEILSILGNSDEMINEALLAKNALTEANICLEELSCYPDSQIASDTFQQAVKMATKLIDGMMNEVKKYQTDRTKLELRYPRMLTELDKLNAEVVNAVAEFTAQDLTSAQNALYKATYRCNKIVEMIYGSYGS
jgi:hypothetical protein